MYDRMQACTCRVMARRAGENRHLHLLVKHCTRARRRKLHPRERVRRVGQAAPSKEQKCTRTHLFGLHDAWNHDSFHSCRGGFFSALKAAPRVQTTTISQRSW